MPTFVGGWRTTKKRGRDDDAIERDREEAIARRKELRIRKQPPPPPPPQPPVETARTKKGDEGNTKNGNEYEHELPKVVGSSSWVKPPCGNPRHRKHREREPFSPQRELFPTKTNTKKRVVRQTNSTNNNRQRLFCERCWDKLIKPVVEKQQPRTPHILPPAIRNVSRGRDGRTRKRTKIVVTPDQQHEERHSMRSEAEQRNNSSTSRRLRSSFSKRRTNNAKVLSFGDSGDPSPRRAPPFAEEARYQQPRKIRKRGLYRSPAARNNGASKSKPKQRELRNICGTQLRPEPDFARSAKHLSETIRKPKKVVHKKGNKGSARISKSRPFQHARTTFREPRTNGFANHSMAGPPRTRSETKFELVRNLLLGTQRQHNTKHAVLDLLEKTSQSPWIGERPLPKPIGTSTIGSNETGVDASNTGTTNNTNCSKAALLLLLDSSGEAMESHRAGEHGRGHSTKNNTIGSTITSETEVTVEANANKGRSSHELQQLSTQQEESNQKPRGIPSEPTTTPRSTKSLETGKEGAANEYNHNHKHNRRPGRSTLAEKNTNTGISSHPTITTNRRQQPAFCSTLTTTRYEANGENASPSQTPSTPSSAVLSLPMNHLFDDSSSQQLSFEGSRNSRSHDDDTCDRQTRTAPNEATFVETIGREKFDPLRDIGFWQRIVEREEARRKNCDGQTSFKHTIASLVLAKNSSSNSSNNNYSNNGFLWLPSVLEGGLGHTGLLEE